MQKQLIRARNIGFCFGVRNAVAMAERILRAQGQLFSNGDIVHNPFVMDRLEARGLRTVDRVSRLKKGPFVIRSHGLCPELVRRIEQKGIPVYNATCPHVKKVQNLVRTMDRKGYSVVIVGDSRHPEVRALRGFGRNVAVFAPGRGTPRLPAGKKLAVVGQTTLSLEEYEHSVRMILDNTEHSEAKVFNTICRVTGRRQAISRELSRNVEAVLVLGGKNSANTRKLYQICRSENPRTFQVESLDELTRLELRGIARIGITSGTSTSEEFIRSAINFLTKKGYEEVTACQGKT